MATIDQATHNVRLFINGQPVMHETLPKITAQGTWTLGLVTSDAARHHKRTEIDDLQIYWGILSSTEIAELAAGRQPATKHVQVPPLAAPAASGTEIVPPAPALVHHWKFDEGFGSVVKDSVSGVIGEAFARDDKPWPEGIRGRALNLEEAFAHLPAVDLGDRASVSFWVRSLGVFLGSQSIYCQCRQLDDYRGRTMLSLGDESFADGSIHLTRTSGGGEIGSKNNAAPPGKWTHVVATFDGDGQKEGARLYVDGEFIRAIKSHRLALTGPILLGHVPEDEQFAHAWIDELQLYRGVLRDDEVQALFRTGETGIASAPTSPPKATPVAGPSLWTTPTAGERWVTSPKSPHVVALSAAGGAAAPNRVWDLTTGELIDEWTSDHNSTAAYLTNNGNWLLSLGRTAAGEGQLQVWRLPEAKLLTTQKTPTWKNARILGFDASLLKFIVFADDAYHYVNLAGDTEKFREGRFDAVAASQDDVPRLMELDARSLVIYEKYGGNYQFKQAPQGKYAFDTAKAEVWGWQNRLVAINRRRVDKQERDFVTAVGLWHQLIDEDLGDRGLHTLHVSPKAIAIAATDREGQAFMYSLHQRAGHQLPGTVQEFTIGDALMVTVAGQPLMFIDPVSGRRLATPLDPVWNSYNIRLSLGVDLPNTFWQFPLRDERVTVSLDGLTAVTWGSDPFEPEKSLRMVWNLATGKRISQWGDTHRSKHLAVSPEAHWCLSAGSSDENAREIRLWRLPDGKPEQVHKLPDGTRFYSADFTSNGANGYVFCDQGIYSFNHLGKFEKVANSCPPFAAMAALTGEVFAFNGKIQVWGSARDLAAGRQPISEFGEMAGLGMAVSADGAIVAVLERQRDARHFFKRFDVKRKRSTGGVLHQGDPAYFSALSPNGELMIPMLGMRPGENKIARGFLMCNLPLESEYGGRLGVRVRDIEHLRPKFTLPPVKAPPATGAASPDDEAPKSTTRTWSSADGRFSVEAELIKVIGGTVYLRRTDNLKEIKVPLNSLSPADQLFLTPK